MRLYRGLLAVFACLTLSGNLAAFQATLVDLARQSQNADFSGFPFTKPFKAGTVLPATCSVGEMFFKIDAPAGQNVFGCAATNAWTLQGTGAVTLRGLDLLDFSTQMTSNQVRAAAGRVSFNGIPCPNFNTDATVTINSGSGGPGVAQLYVSDSCALVLEYPNTLTLNLGLSGVSAQAVATPGVPATAFWVAELTINNGTFTARSDKRAAFDHAAIMAGTGVTIDCSQRVCLASIDPAVVPNLGAYNTFTGTLDAKNAVKTFPSRVAAADPATCSVGEQYFNTVAKLRKDCTEQNVWSAGGGGSYAKSVHVVQLSPGGVGSNGSLYPGSASYPASGSPDLDSQGSAPFKVVAARFGPDVTASVNFAFPLPSSWDGGTVGLKLFFFPGSGGANNQVVRWTVAADCIAAGGTANDHTYSSAQNIDKSVTNVTAGVMAIATLSPLTMNSCAAGSLVYLKIARAGDATQDTLAASTSLLSAEVQMLLSLQ
jgi:hypothetical protein